MKKKGYYEYDPVIYPRMLCVSNSDAITYDEVREKSNKKLCSFVNFASKDSMRMGVCCYEASHVCDAIEDAIGMEHGGEPSAYLMGWIASCINKARLGIGDFVELKDKEK